jgi:hypothetical protein
MSSTNGESSKAQELIRSGESREFRPLNPYQAKQTSNGEPSNAQELRSMTEENTGQYGSQESEISRGKRPAAHESLNTPSSKMSRLTGNKSPFTNPAKESKHNLANPTINPQLLFIPTASANPDRGWIQNLPKPTSGLMESPLRRVWASASEEEAVYGVPQSVGSQSAQQMQIMKPKGPTIICSPESMRRRSKMEAAVRRLRSDVFRLALQYYEYEPGRDRAARNIDLTNLLIKTHANPNKLPEWSMIKDLQLARRTLKYRIQACDSATNYVTQMGVDHPHCMGCGPFHEMKFVSGLMKRDYKQPNRGPIAPQRWLDTFRWLHTHARDKLFRPVNEKEYGKRFDKGFNYLAAAIFLMHLPETDWKSRVEKLIASLEASTREDSLAGIRALEMHVISDYKDSSGDDDDAAVFDKKFIDGDRDSSEDGNIVTYEGQNKGRARVVYVGGEGLVEEYVYDIVHDEESTPNASTSEAPESISTASAEKTPTEKASFLICPYTPCKRSRSKPFNRLLTFNTHVRKHHTNPATGNIIHRIEPVTDTQVHPGWNDTVRDPTKENMAPRSKE